MHPAYFHTVLDGEPPPGGWPEAWAVITAYAPTGTVRPPAVDAAADARLKVALDALGVPVWRVTGRSPEGDHAEPGWGAVMSLTAAKAIGRSFEQKAVFWIQHGELWVADCSPCGPGVRIGALAPKLNAPPVSFAGREALVSACAGDAVRVAAVLRFLGPSATRAAAWTEFVRDADASCYTLPAWCEAAAAFQHRLEQARRVSPFAKKLGYVCCCAESQAPVPPSLRPEFAEALATMWDTYGYDG